MASLPYERRPKETDPAWEAFVIYRDMGLDRSLAKVGVELGKDKSLIDRWSSNHEWRKRVVAWDMDVDRRKRIGDLKGVEDMRRRQTRLALRLQALGELELEKILKRAEHYTEMAVVDDTLMLKLIEAGAKLERVVRGEPGEIIETHTGESVDLSGLSIDELRMLRAVRAKLAVQRGTDDENDTVH